MEAGKISIQSDCCPYSVPESQQRLAEEAFGVEKFSFILYNGLQTSKRHSLPVWAVRAETRIHVDVAQRKDSTEAMLEKYGQPIRAAGLERVLEGTVYVRC